MSDRAHFPLRSLCLISATMICIVALMTPQVQAQPGNSKPADIEQLQSQLAELQSKIESMNQQDQNENSIDNDRVRSVGSQRTKRTMEPVQEYALHIRLYDLSDLFAVSPHYPAVMPNDIAISSGVFNPQQGQMMNGGGQGGGYSGGSGGVFSIPSSPTPPTRQEAASISMKATQVSMDQMVETIKQTVEPDMWGTSRDQAKVQFLGNTLLITATESMHSQINNLLNLFREHWGKRRTVSIQTYLIRAGSAEAAELLDEKSTELGAGVVNPEKWKAFLESAKTEKRFAYTATLTGHNNQTLHALSGQQRQLVLDAEPFLTTSAATYFDSLEDVGPFGEEGDSDDGGMGFLKRTRQVVGFRPVRKSFHNGTVIQVTPLATRGGNFVILDLHAKVNELVKPEPEAQKPTMFATINETQTAEIELDQANFVTYQLSTTVRCPKDQVILAGGMTYDPNAGEDVPNLYLFVKTSVHTITEDKSDWTGEAEPAAQKKSEK